MIIPTRIHRTGDKVRADNYLGRAKSEFLKLEKNMKLRGLTQLSSTATVNGVVIECVKTFNIKEIRVHAPFSKGEVKELAYCYECFCDSCFAIGRIMEVTTTGDCYLYNVDVCHKEGEEYIYTLFEDIIAVDKATYEVDQLVMLAPMLQEDTESCCVNETSVSMCLFTTADIEDEVLFPCIIPACITYNELYAMWEKKRVLSQ